MKPVIKYFENEIVTSGAKATRLISSDFADLKAFNGQVKLKHHFIKEMVDAYDVLGMIEMEKDYDKQSQSVSACKYLSTLSESTLLEQYREVVESENVTPFAFTAQEHKDMYYRLKIRALNRIRPNPTTFTTNTDVII